MLDPTLVWEETVAYPIDSNGYQYKTLNYSTQYPNGVKLLMMYDYFAQPHFVDYPYLNASRTLPADSFKGSIRISVRKKKNSPFVLDSAFVILFFSRLLKPPILYQGWKPKNLTNLFCIQLDTAAAPYFGTILPVNNGFFYTISVDLGTSVVQNINILSAALLQGNVPAAVKYYSEFVGTPEYYPQLEIAGFKLFFFFPNFNDSLFYDPGTLLSLSLS